MESSKCTHCKKMFKHWRHVKRQFCSQECHFEAQRIVRICPVCGKGKKGQKNRPVKKYCSIQCWGIAHRKQKIISNCKQCGKKIYCHKSRIQKFCSTKCHNKFRTLPVKEFWRRKKERVKLYRNTHPEKTAEWKHRRRTRETNGGESFTAEEWKAMKRRFNYRCAKCKKRTKLTIDHIIPVSANGKNSIDNIQPLCMPCNSRKSYKVPVS